MESRDDGGARRVAHIYNVNTFTLPGRSYSGGITYQYTQSLIEFYQDASPQTPPPIPVDMISLNRCLPGMY